MRFSSPLFGVIKGAAALLVLLLAGTAGYLLIEGWPFLDALFMTVITISTVGYNEVYPLSPAGEAFSIVLILISVGAVFYILTNVVRYFLEGEFRIRMGRQRMEAKISKLSNHFILCGYGRVGQEIAHALSQEEVEFVIIELNETGYIKALENDYLAINADATINEVLEKAKIPAARGLIAAIGDDAENTYAVLAAHGLNPSLPIIARASSKEAMNRLILAGAKHVISPPVIGGQRMARLAVRPTTVQFMETVFSNQQETLLIEEIEIEEESSLVGLTIEQVEDRFPRAKVLAQKKHDGTVIIDPHSETIVETADVITVFGPYEQLQNMEGCCQSISGRRGTMKGK